MSVLNFPFQVNGVDVPTPSVFEWGLQDVSAADSGRTSDARMHKNLVARKEKIQLSWSAPSPEKTATVLQAFLPEYFDVTYRSPLTNTIVTKTFYRGDANAPAYWWARGGRFQKLSFNIIEV